MGGPNFMWGFEGVTYPWFNVSGYYFDAMNMLHEFAASPMEKITYWYLSNNNFKTVC